MRGGVLLSVLLLGAVAFHGCPWEDSCLVGDTEVETPRGAVRISELEPGDEVWAVDVLTGERHARKVARTLPGWSRSIRRPTLEGHRMHGLTPTHPVFDPVTRTFRPAGELTSGSAVRNAHHADVRVMAVEQEDAILWPVRVYDLELEGPEHAFLADGVVVHNKTIAFPEAAFADLALCRCVARAAQVEPEVPADCNTDASVGATVDGGTADGTTCCGGIPCCTVTFLNATRISTLACAGQGIRSLDMFVSAQPLEGVTWDLSENMVTRLGASDFDLVAPEAVDLSHNPLTDVSAFAFAFNCRNHTRLDFSETQLSTDDNAALEELAARGCMVTPSSF